MKNNFFILILATILISWNFDNSDTIDIKSVAFNTVVEKERDTIIYTNGFDFPVGIPNAKKYYNAQRFRKNGHLGDDWNGVGGGNTDFGDSFHSIANGYVVFAEDIRGGWGKVIRIVHYLNKDLQVESLYAHCDKMLVKVGDFVTKGQQIGTIGNCDGAYWAHLHLELRSEVGMEIGGGYSSNTEGYLDPTKFIKKHRK